MSKYDGQRATLATIRNMTIGGAEKSARIADITAHAAIDSAEALDRIATALERIVVALAEDDPADEPDIAVPMPDDDLAGFARGVRVQVEGLEEGGVGKCTGVTGKTEGETWAEVVWPGGGTSRIWTRQLVIIDAVSDEPELPPLTPESTKDFGDDFGAVVAKGKGKKR